MRVLSFLKSSPALVGVCLFLFFPFSVVLTDDGVAVEASARPEPLDKAEALRLAKMITAEAYPDSDEALADNLVTEYYLADGTGEVWDDGYTKILTERGKKGNRTISLGFRLPYTTAEVDLLEIIKPDGASVPVDVKAQSKIVVSSGQMSSNIYDPNHKVLQINIPELEVGDIIHCVSHRRNLKTIMPNTWADIELFEYTSFIKRLRYELRAPKEMPPRQIKLRAEIPGAVTFRKEDKPDGSAVYRWEARDVPRMFNEPGMPPLDSVVQRLLVSTIPDWKTISRWYWELSKPRIEAVTPEMREKVAELIKDAPDDAAKTKAIFFFVAQKIRYMGITTEKEAPGYEPHDVKITFDNKYGVCRDKAALLVAMLRLAGLQAYPALINAGPKKDPDVPQPFFNHAIAAAELKPGEYTLMDPTDENTKDLLPSYLCNMSYLVARPDGETILITPVVPFDCNMTRVSTEGSLDENGGLRARSEIRYEGINDNYVRWILSRKTPEERRRWFEGGLKRSIPAARLTSFSVVPENLFDTSATVVATLEYETENVLIDGGGVSMLDLPWFGGGLGWLGANLLQSANLEKRRFPLIVDSTFGRRETLKLSLGKAVGEVVSMPRYTGVANEDIRFAMTASREGGTLECSSEFALMTVEFSTAGYLELKKALRAVEFDLKKVPLFKKATKGVAAGNGDDSGSQIIDERKEIVFHDAHSYTYTHKLRKKILDYRGKKRGSELKIHYNPAWEEASIVSASVTAPDGSRKEIAKEEMNMMDAPWSGSAPRYPSGKILVASLPGVEVGSVIETEIIHKAKDRPFVSGCEFFRDTNPIVKRTVTYSYPEGLAVKMAKRNWSGVSEKITKADGRVTIEWTVEGQPSIAEEPNLPPRWVYAPSVLVSTGDWKDYGAELGALLDKASKDQPQAIKRAGQLAVGLKPREFVKAVRDYAAKNVRNAGPVFHELPLSAVTPADRTLADGYGNALDRAVVLAALLRAGGLDPKFVLISGDPCLDEVVAPAVEAPQRFLFGGVLVKVDCDGEGIFLNDTDQYADLGVTASEGRLSLDPATGKIGGIAPPPGKENRSELSFEVKVEADGKAQIKRVRKSYGILAAAERRMYAEMTPEERSRHFQSIVAGFSQSAKAVGDLKTDFNGYPGMEELTVEIPDYAVVDAQSRLYFSLPFGFTEVFHPDSDCRANPMLWSSKIDSRYEVSLRLPDGYDKVDISPSSVDIEMPGSLGKLNVRSAQEGPGQWRVSGALRLKECVISPDIYKDLLGMNNIVALKNSAAFLIEKK